MPKLELDTIPQTNATGYPPPYDREVAGRWYRRMAPVAGLTQMGVSHVTLKPGAWSSHRHWHHGEDELVVMLSGEAVLVEEGGETVLRSGDCVAFPKGGANGHHLQNRSVADCVFVAIGTGADEGGCYADIDMDFAPHGYMHKDGTPYPAQRIK